MFRKENTTALIIAFLTTVVLASTGFWWVTQNSPRAIQGRTSDASSHFADVKNVPDGDFKYGGSTTWATIRPPVYKAIQSSHPNFKLIYVDPSSGSNLTPGSGSGIQMLIDGQLTFSLSSRELKDKDFEKAKPKNIQLNEIPVGIDGIAIAVNPNLNIKGLTLEQIKNIYSGKIINWQEVGGPNLTIIPYSRGKEGGTVDFFKERLQLDSFGDNVIFVENTTTGNQRVFQNLGGIYYASAPEVVPQCTIKTLSIGEKPNDFVPPYDPPVVKSTDCPAKRNVVNTEAFHKGHYPLTRKLFVIVNSNDRIEKQAGEAYANMLLTNEGQDLIEKAGFVKIRE